MSALNRQQKRVSAGIARSVASKTSRRGFAHLPEILAAELGRPRARFRNPIMAGYLEGITQALYDVYAVAANTATIKLTMFQVPQGNVYNLGGVTSFVKTVGHTSMVQNG